MTGRLLRILTPWGWLAAVLISATILIVVGRAEGLRRDPFGLAARRLEQAERRADRVEADLDARRLETEASTDQARRLHDHHQQAVALARVTAIRQAQARSAHDALDPLDVERAARLRAHDGELCRLAADLCGPAETGAAASRPDIVPAGSPAADADHG